MLKRSNLQSKFLLLLVFAVSLGGCSFKSMYNQLDWLLLGMVEDFVSLSDKQELDINRRIKHLLDWHRTEQIPLYIQDLQRIKQFTAVGLTDDSTKDVLEMIMQRWSALKSRVATDMAAALMTVDETQKAGIYAEIENRNREIREEYDGLTGEERQERISERIIENFERWLGDLNDAQKALVRERVSELRPIHEERLAFRASWQQAFRKVMDSEPDQQAQIGKLTELFAYPEKWQSDVYKEKLAHNSAQVRQMVLSVDRTLTGEQKAHLQARIDYFIGLLQGIADGE